MPKGGKGMKLMVETSTTQCHATVLLPSMGAGRHGMHQRRTGIKAGNAHQPGKDIRSRP